MSRALLVLNSKNVRERAKRWIDAAPQNTSVEFREARRSLEANAKMWASLTDVSKQVLHMGRQYPADIWKLLFMHALGQEVKFIPALDGQTVVPLGYRSSELDKAEMSELIEFILSWGISHGVIFHDPETERGAASADADSPEKEARINAPTLNTQPNRNKETIT